ncbi:GNAT family N-acetyltransferase [Paenibacillus terreus]|uniref:GNAT family N-acetyltransferase n=1 Tax=Paenibacillus terreus TaxID=1387834 RepID=A0ABV5BCW1_9BACL
MIRLREAILQDLPEMLAIYNEAVLNSAATFDLEAQTLEERTVWFNIHGGKYPLIVAELEGKVAGYACLSPFRAKPAYAYSTELSIYIDAGFRGHGIGSTLMTDILNRAADLGLSYGHQRTGRRQ